MRPHRAIHPLHVHLATALLCLAACRVEGYYYYPDSGDAYVPIDDWVTRLGGADRESIAPGTAIAAAPDGDLVLVGSFEGTTNLGGSPITAAGDPTQLIQGDIWVLRYRPDGRHVWSIGLGGPYVENVNAVAVDSAGDVYIVGGAYLTDFGGGPRSGGFVVKLAGANGAYIWDRTFAGTAGTATGIAVLDSGTVIFSGMFTGTINLGGEELTSMPLDGGDCVLAALDSSTGMHRWSRSLTSTGAEFDISNGRTARCNVTGIGGDVIAAGTFRGTARLGGGSLTSLGEDDVFIARFRGSDGGHVWSRRHGGAAHETAYALATDGTRIFVGGSFSGTASFGQTDLTAIGRQDAFVAAYEAASGAPVWSQRFGSASPYSFDDETTSIAANSSQLAVTLGFVETITLGDQTFKANSDISASNPDTAIARLNPASGEPFDAWHFGSAGSDRMAVTFTGRALAGSGTFAQTTYLFGTSLTSLGNEDLAVFRVELDRGKP